MNFDDLKDQWATYDKKLDQSIKLNTLLLRQTVLSKTSFILQRLSRTIFIELLINFVAMILLGSFIADWMSNIRFLVPALTLDLAAISLITFSIYQLIILRGINYSDSIIAIQKQLESLRINRILATKWTLLIAPLLWTPLLIVLLKGICGIDAYVVFSRYWLASNFLLGVALIPFMIFVSKRYAERWQRSPLIQRLLNDIAGRNLTAALAFLDTLCHYNEQESE